MTQEEKQLLLKDLCGRLPYGVNGLVTFHKTMGENSTFNSVIDGKLYDRFANLQDSWYDNIPSIKPYLRPMSSMTDEERDEFRTLGGIMSHNVQNDTWAISAFTPEAYDWLNAHHFDYRGLIPMGLALEAPEGMYKTE